MNIDNVLIKYFSGNNKMPSIEMFDEKNIYSVYTHIVNTLHLFPEIELSVLQALSYCFYEILDNVLTHSGKKCGFCIYRYLPSVHIIQILVADDGIGICQSLQSNNVYRSISEDGALMKCLEDMVTDGLGMGFGLYSTFRMIQAAGLKLTIHSGSHILTTDGYQKEVHETDEWQGTTIFFELRSNAEINANAVVDFRTDCEGEFNDNFDNDNLEDLW